MNLVKPQIHGKNFYKKAAILRLLPRLNDFCLQYAYGINKEAFIENGC